MTRRPEKTCGNKDCEGRLCEGGMQGTRSLESKPTHVSRSSLRGSYIVLYCSHHQVCVQYRRLAHIASHRQEGREMESAWVLKKAWVPVAENQRFQIIPD